MSTIGNVYFSDKLEEITHIDMNKIQGGTIPRILHLIWFGEMQQYATDNLKRWKELMPHWTIKLWGESDLGVFSSDVIRKVHEATKYSQKSDILRFNILQKYGGVYVDTDVRPNSNLDPIIALNYDIVICHEQVISWEYVAGWFIAAIPNHPAITCACDYLMSAKLNTLDLHITTGPNLWGRAIGNGLKTAKKYGVLQYDTFLGTGIFGVHEYTHSWKEPDEIKNTSIVDGIDANSTTELCNIMLQNRSDKGGVDNWHNYTLVYDKLFSSLRQSNIRLFELGIGTNNTSLPSNMGTYGTPGASLRGWRQYFPNATIFGADIDKDILFEEDRIRTFYCDQLDPVSISNLWSTPDLIDNFDIIIEDGLHTFEANVCFFENSIHKIKSGGIYVIEDIAVKDIQLFKDKIAVWQTLYPNISFELVVVPHSRNTGDNCLVIARSRH
jgi:hypothetical protein